jgi:hypothetical protein
MVGKIGPSDMFTIVLGEEGHENSYQSYATCKSKNKWG